MLCKYLFFGGLMVLWAAGAEAEIVNLDGAIKLVKSFYKESEASVSAGDFSGKYQPDKKCQLLKKYFPNEMLNWNRSKICDLPKLLTRYPSYELNFEGDYESPPKYNIVNSSLMGERAEVAIEMKPSDEKRDFFVARTEWVLRFSNDHWLIYGARICDSYVSPKNAEILRARRASTFAMYRCTDFGEPPLSPNLTPD